MTRFTHSILFFFAVALALLCSAVLMLFLNETRDGASFGALVSTALILAVIGPAAVALVSLRFVKWQQPLTAWLVFYLITALVTVALGQRLLS
ncbi:MAG: hypothetical protein KJO66_04820 [Gammaproteobacteria bacterium]|nr:hypothetical protein [Gammaproteobacteria bacterium]